MSPVDAAILIVYGLGFLGAWASAARFWMKEFGSTNGETLMAGVWGFLFATIWPFSVVAFSIGRIARLTIREDKP